MIHLTGGEALALASLAEAMTPKPPLPFDLWLPKNIVLVDGPRKGEFWSAADAPYLVEIAQCLSLEHPANLVTVRKAQQTGVSILALAWCLYIAETAPDNILYGVPGIDALQDINGQKLQPLIDEWHKETGKRIILPMTQRSGRNSTTYEKRFAGGYIALANANTVMDLSMKTCRYGVKDEVSKWQELPNGADPETLFFGRFTAFRRQRSYKILELSTPELDSGDEFGDAPGHCRIDRSFRRSDKRYWTVTCAECAGAFVMSDDTLHVDRKSPHKSVLVCPHCGHWISESERVFMVREGRYVKTDPGPDNHPGFHVDAFMSLMMSLGDIADDKIKAEGRGESGAKDYDNLLRALPHLMKGSAPDWQRLMERREDYPTGVVPPEGLILTGGADVQHYGIWVESVAFGSDRQTWSVFDTLFEGPTDDIRAGAWLALDAFRRDGHFDSWGRQRRLDALAVDASDGKRMTQVLEWCRERPDTYAINGQHGRGKPAIGIPSRKSVRKSGSRMRVGGAMLWPVGTWTLKADFYGNLHKLGLVSGEPEDPPGYCHFRRDQTEEYFKQVTAETFVQKMTGGRYVEEWLPLRRDNHMLDCRIYAMAMAEHLGLTRMTADQWARLKARMTPKTEPDLLSPPSVGIAADDRQEEPPAKQKTGSGRSKWRDRT